MDKVVFHGRRLVISIAGGIVLLIGLVMLIYPGPGWLVIFAGLAILSTEFKFASNILDWLKDKYALWLHWFKRQHGITKFLAAMASGAVVILTLWLTNTLSLVNSLFNLNQAWLVTPFLW